jgi:DNA mismatch endonuclease (patch repair protein)
MERQRRRDTAPELLVRRLLHARGQRFRVDARLEPDLRVRGDIVWRSQKIAVFIDGCFWHGCPLHTTSPKANARWWQEKIATNVARDRRTDRALGDRGWHVLRFWEHESPVEVVDSIISVRSNVGRRHGTRRP